MSEKERDGESWVEKVKAKREKRSAEQGSIFQEVR